MARSVFVRPGQAGGLQRRVGSNQLPHRRLECAFQGLLLSRHMSLEIYEIVFRTLSLITLFMDQILILNAVD